MLCFSRLACVDARYMFVGLPSIAWVTKMVRTAGGQMTGELAASTTVAQDQRQKGKTMGVQTLRRQEPAINV